MQQKQGINTIFIKNVEQYYIDCVPEEKVTKDTFILFIFSCTYVLEVRKKRQNVRLMPL